MDPMNRGERRQPRAPSALLALAVAFAFFAPVPTQAAEFSPDDIVFPVVGDVYYSDTWGAPRSGGRTHEGTDIMTYGVKGLPVVAAADGVVKWIGSTCCYLSIDHGGGWETWYIHLNNDTQNPDGSYTDDGQGWGIADGIEVGTEVVAGQLIGWVGDSGNAEWVAPQLHFEIRHDGVATNPYPYLVGAPVLDEPGPYVWNGYFRDDEGNTHEANIDKIAEAGITKGCNPPDNDKYCPYREITRGEMAAFLRRTLDLPSVEEDYFTDDTGDTFEDDINALAAAGIAFGCTETEYCSRTPLLRGEMAELLVRAFGYTNPDGTDFFTDDDGHPFEDAINRLKAAGITVGCNPPDNTEYCPDRTLIRAEMATFFVRALGL